MAHRNTQKLVAECLMSVTKKVSKWLLSESLSLGSQNNLD